MAIALRFAALSVRPWLEKRKVRGKIQRRVQIQALPCR